MEDALRARRLLLFLAVGLLGALALAGRETLVILDGFTPNPPKKMEKGLEVQGLGYHLRNSDLDVTVQPLFLPEIGRYFSERGLKNPFYDIPREMNYFFFKVRLENLSKSETLEFLPTNAVMESCMAKDESSVYQTFYKFEDGEERLAVLGKTLFLKPLMLPPGQWIERLLFFEYDDNFSAHRMTLVLANMAVGRNQYELQFPYRAKYTKEKR
jgi:hypothetical protein